MKTLNRYLVPALLIAFAALMATVAVQSTKLSLAAAQLELKDKALNEQSAVIESVTLSVSELNEAVASLISDAELVASLNAAYELKVQQSEVQHKQELLAVAKMKGSNDESENSWANAVLPGSALQLLSTAFTNENNHSDKHSNSVAAPELLYPWMQSAAL